MQFAPWQTNLIQKIFNVACQIRILLGNDVLSSVLGIMSLMGEIFPDYNSFLIQIVNVPVSGFNNMKVFTVYISSLE